MKPVSHLALSSSIVFWRFWLQDEILIWHSLFLIHVFSPEEGRKADTSAAMLFLNKRCVSAAIP